MDWLFSSTLAIVLLGSTLLGVVGGTVGCFALLRRQSLLGDALAHAALPGVCIAFLITGTKSTGALTIGAMVAGIVGALFIMLVVRASRVKEDSALGIVLSVFFGLGVVLLTLIQRSPGGNQSGLDRFLFGQAATLMKGDVLLFSVVGFGALLIVLAFYKQLKLLCFDSDYGAMLGFHMRAFEVLLTVLLVVVVVVGLQTVGVVLVVASLITPAAAARQWTDRFGVMLVVSAGIGGAASAVGVAVSAPVARMPTGPVIVLVSSACLAVSMLLAPRRGLIWGAWRTRQTRRRIRNENMLKDIYRWAERADDFRSYLSLPVLLGMRGDATRHVQKTRRRLRSMGDLEARRDGVRLTNAGRRKAEGVVRRHRLWELFLVQNLELSADHVHRDAEAMEHVLTDTMIEEFENALGNPTLDPHGRRIPPAPLSAGRAGKQGDG